MKSKKKINWELMVFLCVVLFILVCLCCGLVRYTPGAKLLAISPFGKLEMMGIDKAVITIDGASVTITDAELLDRIVNETKVATEAYSCDHSLKDRTIDLYREDKLVRTMKWYDCGDTVRVYDANLTHWLFPPLLGGSVDGGYIKLPQELVKELEALF